MRLERDNLSFQILEDKNLLKKHFSFALPVSRECQKVLLKNCWIGCFNISRDWQGVAWKHVVRLGGLGSHLRKNWQELVTLLCKYDEWMLYCKTRQKNCKIIQSKCLSRHIARGKRVKVQGTLSYLVYAKQIFVNWYY